MDGCGAGPDEICTCEYPYPKLKLSRRVDIQEILADPVQRRRLTVKGIIGDQAREGITTTREQAEYAYDRAVASSKTCKVQCTCEPGWCQNIRKWDELQAD